MLPLALIGATLDTFRELSATLTLQPNQIAVIGGLADRPRTLGSFLFTQPEPNSDRLLQRVVLVRAQQEQLTQNDDEPKPTPRLEPVEPPKQ